MQRSGAATRRFYAAFYQLNVRSANPTRPCLAGVSLAARRANSTTTGETSKKPEAIRRGHQGQLYPPKRFLGSTELLRDAPVQSTAECPLGSLQTWSHAIRERSSNSVTVELSVPGWVSRTPEVARNAKTHEVQLHLPDNKKGNKDFDIQPVLLSGDPDDVKAVWKAIHDSGSREAPRQPRWAASEPNELTNEIRDPRPPPWRYFHRRTLTGQFEADFCIPETAWRPLAECGCVQWLKQEFNVRTEVLGAYDSCTYLRLNGTRLNVVNATGALQQANKWTDSQAVGRYNYIRHAVNQDPFSSSAPSEKQDSIEGGSGLQRHEHAVRENRSPTKIRLRRIFIPESLQRHFASSQTSPLAEIQRTSGVRALRCRPMAGSQRYLQLLGTDAAVERAENMLEEHLCKDQTDGSGMPLGIDRLRMPENEFRPADATHFAWIKVPDETIDMKAIIPDIKRSLRASDCVIKQFRAAGRADFMLRGTEEAVNFGISGCQDSMDVHRARQELPTAKLEVHKMGLIQHVSKETPWEGSTLPKLDGKAALADPLSNHPSRKVNQEEEMDISSLLDASQAHPELVSKDVKQKETRASSASAGGVGWSPEHAAASTENNVVAGDQHANRTNQRLGDDLRSALRYLTQPVALVVSRMPETISDRGVTVSSFCTVTLQPEPIVSFNLRVPSRTWDAIHASRKMEIFLLAASPEGAALAHTFTLPYEQPYEPFKKIRKMGASVRFRPDDTRISWPNAVYASVKADLLPDKGNRVGDHVIVIARVRRVRLEESSPQAKAGALAYAMRGYRSLGDELKPMETVAATSESGVVDAKPAETNPVKKTPEWELGRAAAHEVDPPNPVQPVKTKSEKTKSVKTESSEEQPASVAEEKEPELSSEQSQELWEEFMGDYIEDLENGDTIPAETQDLSAPADLTSGKEGHSSSDANDIGTSSPIMDEESLQQELAETEASYAAKGLPSQTAKDNPMLAEALKAAAGAYNESPDAATKPTGSTSQSPGSTTNTSSNAVLKKTPNTPSQNVTHRPSGVDSKKKPSNRTFSTWTRSQTRSYSSTSDSKKILKSTVEDFLCQVPTNNRLYNNLIAAQREAEKLEALVADGKVPAEKIAQVEVEAQAIRRRVARELAWRNAQDLRILLDQGHVSPERAQWLETNLEQGQAILLKEAELLRAELEEGRLVKEEFEGGKAALMQDYEEFEGLLKRLRDFVDEDDVSAGEGAGEQESAGSGSGRP